MLHMMNKVRVEVIQWCFCNKLWKEQCGIIGCSVVLEEPVLHEPEMQSLSPILLPERKQHFTLELSKSRDALREF